MSSSEQKYIKDKELSESVAKTKVSHGMIEIAVRTRTAKSKKELDLELKRLKILSQVNESSLGKEITIPKELKKYQQLILIIGNLSLKNPTEILLACKRLGYSGKLNKHPIMNVIKSSRWHKIYFKYDNAKGWQLSPLGQNEFSRLKQFI